MHIYVKCILEHWICKISMSLRVCIIKQMLVCLHNQIKNEWYRSYHKTYNLSGRRHLEERNRPKNLQLISVFEGIMSSTINTDSQLADENY